MSSKRSSSVKAPDSIIRWYCSTEKRAIGNCGTDFECALTIRSGYSSAGRSWGDGRDVPGLPAHAMPELGVSHVPEGRQLFPHMTVEEKLGLGAYTGAAGPAPARPSPTSCHRRSL